MECRVRYAEAFTCTKSVIVPAAFTRDKAHEKDLLRTSCRSRPADAMLVFGAPNAKA
jgi:hypothetical protein